MIPAYNKQNDVPRNGKSRNPAEVARVLDALRKDCNVIAPPGLHGIRLPNGFSVVWSEVDVDTKDARDGGDVYAVSGGRTLTSSALFRVATALGITWDSYNSHKVNQDADPFYCVFLAVGSYMGPDGMPVPISGTNRTDLRDGSPHIESFRDSRTGQLNDKMIRQQRQHILSISESKARARAIRTHFGLRALTQQLIVRPWIAFRIQITGETDDPRTSQMFEAEIFRAALGAKTSLYGPTQQMGTAPQPQQLGARVVQALPAHEDDVLDYDSIPDSGDVPVYQAPAPASVSTPQPQPAAATAPAPRQPRRGATNATWPWAPKKAGDPEKGTPLSEVPSQRLQGLVDFYEKKLADDPSDKFAATNKRLMDAAVAELASRNDGVLDRGDDPDKY